MTRAVEESPSEGRPARDPIDPHDLTSLLELWGEVEPDRCDFSDGIYYGVVLVDGAWSRVTLPGSVLAAVLEAIDARGWPWSLKRVGAHVEATVYVRRYLAISANETPTVTLLAAYVAALETVRGEAA